MAIRFTDFTIVRDLYNLGTYRVFIIVKELDHRSCTERLHREDGEMHIKLHNTCANGIYLTSAPRFGWINICLEYLDYYGIRYTDIKYSKYGRHSLRVKSNDDEMNDMLAYLANEDVPKIPLTLEHMSYRVLRNHDLMETILPHGLRKRYHLV